MRRDRSGPRALFSHTFTPISTVDVEHSRFVVKTILLSSSSLSSWLSSWLSCGRRLVVFGSGKAQQEREGWRGIVFCENSCEFLVCCYRFRRPERSFRHRKKGMRHDFVLSRAPRSSIKNCFVQKPNSKSVKPKRTTVTSNFQHQLACRAPWSRLACSLQIESHIDITCLPHTARR